ncbi:unnamed protein product [Adineta ricciae]|nr:unnamed protein product [Adineta ricciae]
MQMPFLKDYFLNLNLFEPRPESNEVQDNQTRRWNLLTTRVYLIVLLSTLIVIALFLSLTSQTTIVKVEFPTKQQFEKLPSNARCPCSQISFPHSKFVSLQTTFHQVCSSDVISVRWFQAINLRANATYFPRGDFQTFGSAQFQALAGFCRLAKANIEQAINSFYLRTFLTPQVLSDTDLQSKIQALIAELQSTAPNTFNGLLRLVNDMIRTNELMNGLLTVATYRYYFLSQNNVNLARIGIGYIQADGYWCTCQIKLCLWSPSGIHQVFNRSVEPFPAILLWQIPGISSGCLPVHSILLSDLECFYNQTCVNKLVSYFPITNETFVAMNATKRSRFHPNSTVKSVVDELMIEDWITNISYENYYSQCAPKLCTFYETSRHKKMYVITKLISLMASLAIGFKLIIPIVMRAVRMLTDRTPRPQTSVCARCQRLLRNSRKVLIELNIFRHYPSTNRQIRYERYATRAYILLILITISILTIYNLSQRSIRSKTIVYPNESEYLQLQQDHPHSLSCPCSSISTPYGTFIQLRPYYHQLCASDLLSEKWMSYTYYLKSDASFFLDYRGTANTHFQTLSTFCQEAQQTIKDALRIFFQTELVSFQVLSPRSFQFQSNSLIENWKSTTINTFVRTVQLVREITHGNQLSNGGFNSIADVNPNTGKTTLQSRSYGPCNCALARSCRVQAGIYQINEFYSRNRTYSVPNFFLGCQTIEALLLSTLQCFYNLSCMLTIHNQSAGVASQPFTFSPLNEKLNPPNETIESIVNRLMVDQWFSNYSFSLYYHKCAPSFCTFEFEAHQSFGYVTGTILSIYGGLSLGLKIVIWIGLRCLKQIMQHITSRLVMWHSIRRAFTLNDKRKVIRRLHFILVIIMLCIFYGITNFTIYTKTVGMKNITLTSYKELLEQSHDLLQCSCSRISIKYKSFLTIQPRFHQICSSDFVSNQWISYLYNLSVRINEFDPADFYHTASGQFQLLQSLCKLSEETLNQSLIQLGESDFINTELLSPDLLENRIQSTINEFQLTMPNLFINTLSLIREMIGTNMILTVFSTNWLIETPSVLFHGKFAHTIPIDYQECNCAVSFKCVSPSRGMLAGCYPLEAMLQSTLECLFIPMCIPVMYNFKVLDISSVNSSRFALNATVESIIDKLMVEELSSKMSYDVYFNQCAPLSCSYSYDDKNDVVEGITTLIGLYGGLSIMCQLLSIFIIKQVLCPVRQINPTTR